MNLSPPEYGIHSWLPSAARKCQFKGMTAQETIDILASITYRRVVPHNEITGAVNLVFSTELSPAQHPSIPKQMAWQKKATDQIFAMFKTTEQDLIDMSIVHPSNIKQRRLIRTLFPNGDGLICIAEHMKYGSKTAPLAEHKDMASKQFIMPAYMSARTGITKKGKVSARALSNTGERRFIVLDFDEPPSEHHASIIRWLMEYRKPLMVIKSGGKSLHAWYRTETEDRDSQFWRLAILAGADPAILRNRSQVVRLPMGTRDTGAVQSVLYFNPNNLPS